VGFVKKNLLSAWHQQTGADLVIKTMRTNPRMD